MLFLSTAFPFSSIIFAIVLIHLWLFLLITHSWRGPFTFWSKLVSILPSQHLHCLLPWPKLILSTPPYPLSFGLTASYFPTFVMLSFLSPQFSSRPFLPLLAAWQFYCAISSLLLPCDCEVAELEPRCLERWSSRCFSGWRRSTGHYYLNYVPVLDLEMLRTYSNRVSYPERLAIAWC